MRYLRLGSSELKVSRFGPDCYSLGIAHEENILASMRRLRAGRLDIVYPNDQLARQPHPLDKLARMRERGVVHYKSSGVSINDLSEVSSQRPSHTPYQSWRAMGA